MDAIYYTLQDFLTFTKGFTYVLMGVGLVGFIGFWRFLTARDDD
ncbi:MAG TPA: hmc operon protein 4 [Desulfomicrobiaceae bacterium]|jgi:hypothetical protein|nr:hmc operon protein 4 [Desulfomicrobiaceae bacterium]